MNVNDDSERQLRAAMERILAGKPIRSNGSYTVTALAAEAGMSRRTAGRASGVLRDFRDAIDGLEKPSASSTDDAATVIRVALADTRTALKDRNAENARLRSQLGILACRVAILSEENAALLTAVGTGSVAPLPSARKPNQPLGPGQTTETSGS